MSKDSFQQLAEISKAEQLTPDIYRLSLLAPEIAAVARPGQFVMLRPGGLLDPLLRRPLSIHQVTAGGLVQVLFKVIGKGTALLAELKPGRSIDLVGPLGRGFPLQSQGRVCLVGGGMGIAPLFFLAREFQRRLPPEQITLLLGARTADELRQLADEFRLLGLDPQLATDDGSLGHHGRVPELFDSCLSGEGWRIYCCGPQPMMRAVADHCRERQWECLVSLETMMACGISACLGCAVASASGEPPYLHVCKDGPVFKATEITWR